MNLLTKKLLLLLLIAYHKADFGMLTSRSSLKKLTTLKTTTSLNRTYSLPSFNIKPTHPEIKIDKKPTDVSSIQKYQPINLWDRLKNWFFRPSIIQTPAKPINQTYQQAIESALNIIKQNRKNLPITPPDMIICTQPGSELLSLSKIKSFDDIEQLFIEKRKEILKKIKLNDNEINVVIADIIKKRNDNIQKNHTKAPVDTAIIHDPKLPFLQTVKETLRSSGINPETVHITTPSSAIKSINNYKSPWVHTNKSNDKIIEIILAEEKATFPTSALTEEKAAFPTPASIIRGPDDYPILTFYYMGRHPNFPLTNFNIAHEVGHIVKNHLNETGLMLTLFNLQKDKYPNNVNRPDFDKAFQDLEALHEIEADITVAMTNPEIAEIAYQEILNLIKSPKNISLAKGIEWSPSKPSKAASPIHSSPETKLHLLQKIREVHAKESEQKNILPTKE